MPLVPLLKSTDEDNWPEGYSFSCLVAVVVVVVIIIVIDVRSRCELVT
jgi:hypothetical protein